MNQLVVLRVLRGGADRTLDSLGQEYQRNEESKLTPKISALTSRRGELARGKPHVLGPDGIRCLLRHVCLERL